MKGKTRFVFWMVVGMMISTLAIRALYFSLTHEYGLAVLGCATYVVCFAAAVIIAIGGNFGEGRVAYFKTYSDATRSYTNGYSVQIFAPMPKLGPAATGFVLFTALTCFYFLFLK